MVKRVGVYWNSGKTHGLSVARSVIELAQGSDMETVLDAALNRKPEVVAPILADIPGDVKPKARKPEIRQ